MPRRQPMDSTCSHRTVTSTPVSSMMWWPLNHLSGLGGCRLSPLDYPIYLRQMRNSMLPDDYQYHAEKARLRLLTSKPGRGWARASLVCGAWSLFVAPAVFGLWESRQVAWPSLRGPNGGELRESPEVP